MSAGLAKAAGCIRIGLGAICLAQPSRVLALTLDAEPDDQSMRVAARVLGVRLVGQGVADVLAVRRTRRADIAVELTHAATMVAAAWRWPEHRGPALASAAVACALAALDIAAD